ncbi:restriction endonuclease subunit S [Mycoplasma suis]|uniref:restriction endonuclease subunit S n=1 Tax=Mycoplasma suis TaxID=57372 RepID=UPI0003102268|nr:restriction endonuclease subunit S [Mycoplasma suis]
MGSKNWEWVTLDKLGKISCGKAISAKVEKQFSFFFNGNIPLIDGQAVNSGRLYISKSTRKLNLRGLSYSKFFPENTVCTVIRGSYSGKTSVLKNSCCLTNNVNSFNSFLKISDPKFIKYSFDSKIISKLISSYAKYATAQPMLCLHHLLSIKFPKPPLEIQQKIGEILSRYDLILDNHERQIELLKNLKASLFKEWFIKLRFPDYEKYSSENGIPEGWRKIRFGDLTEIQIGKKPASHSELLDGLGKYPFFTCSTKTKNSYTFSYDFPSLLVSAGGAITVSFMMGNLKLAPTFLFRN